MKLNLNSVKQILSTIVNPNQAIEIMLNKMPPDYAQMLRQAMNNNDFKGALQTGINQGIINRENINNAKNLYRYARNFGLIKQNISNADWQTFERMVNESSNQPSNQGFKRF